MTVRSSLTALIMALACVVTPFKSPGTRAETPASLPALVTGPITPLVEAKKGEDGLYHQAWELNSFLDLREDLAEATAKGRRFAVIFEQRGCIYCTKMHTEVLAQKYINDYVRENFTILQLDLFGAREVTDFDGQKMSETKLAERWGVQFTPTIIFYSDEAQTKGLNEPGHRPPTQLGPEVVRMSLGFGPATFFDLFVWVKAKIYARDRNFQRFHIGRMQQRDASQSAPPPVKN
jgi:thioredoxin-related protein